MRGSKKPKTRLGEVILQLREQRGWTQEDVANEAILKGGLLKRSHVQRLQAGDFSNSRLSTFIGLSKAFNVHPSVFFEAAGLLEPAESAFLEFSDPDVYGFFMDVWPHLDSNEKELVRRILRIARDSMEKRLGGKTD